MKKDKTTKKEIDGFEERFDKKFPNVLTELGYDYPKGTDNFKKIKQFISQLLEEKDRECIEAIKSVTKTNDSYYKIKMDDLIEKVEKMKKKDRDGFMVEISFDIGYNQCLEDVIKLIK